jgi:hypothetical protein
LPGFHPIVARNGVGPRWRRSRSGVRDPAALAKLPGAEPADWQKLWADVAALLQKAEAGGTQ